MKDDAFRKPLCSFMSITETSNSKFLCIRSNNNNKKQTICL